MRVHSILRRTLTAAGMAAAPATSALTTVRLPALVGSHMVLQRDHVFHWATAETKGREVVLSSPAVSAPAAVRYDWADNPTGNLYNREGLPTVPFQTTNATPQLFPEP